LVVLVIKRLGGIPISYLFFPLETNSTSPDFLNTEH